MKESYYSVEKLPTLKESQPTTSTVKAITPTSTQGAALLIQLVDCTTGLYYQLQQTSRT